MITWTTLSLLAHWLIAIGMVIYVPQRRPPAAARSWLLLILLLPWLGLLLYLLIGRAALPNHRREQQQRVSKLIRSTVAARTATATDITLVPPHWSAIATLAQALGDFPVRGGNHCELLSDYQDSIARLVADIDGATHHVHLLFYIVAPDRTGTLIAEALIRAANRGVRCRLLMDGSVQSAAFVPCLHPCKRLASRSWRCCRSACSVVRPRVSIYATIAKSSSSMVTSATPVHKTWSTQILSVV